MAVPLVVALAEEPKYTASKLAIRQNHQPIGPCPLGHGLQLAGHQMQTAFSGDWNFSNVHSYCERMKLTKEIKSFQVSTDPERGRLIYVESESGWDPEPLFEEFPPIPADPIPN